MIDEYETQYVFRRLSELKKVDDTDRVRNDLVSIYEDCTDVHTTRREASDILVDFYTSGYNMGGNLITMYSFIDEMRSINRVFDNIEK